MRQSNSKEVIFTANHPRGTGRMQEEIQAFKKFFSVSSERLKNIFHL